MSNFFDPKALVVFLIITAVCVGINRKNIFTESVISLMSDMIFYAAFSVAIAWQILVLSNVGDLKDLGPELAFSLLLLFYASLIKLISLIIVKYIKHKQ